MTVFAEGMTVDGIQIRLVARCKLDDGGAHCAAVGLDQPERHQTTGTLEAS